MSEDLCNRTDRYTKNECERELRLPPPAHYIFFAKKRRRVEARTQRGEHLQAHTHTRLKIAAKIDGERIMLKASGQWAHVQRETFPGGENEQYHFCAK